MFDKLKKLNELRNLQNNIKKERVESTINGVRIVIDGSFDIVELSINPALDVKTQETAIKECFADAKNKIQAILAKNFAGSLFS